LPIRQQRHRRSKLNDDQVIDLDTGEIGCRAGHREGHHRHQRCPSAWRNTKEQDPRKGYTSAVLTHAPASVWIFRTIPESESSAPIPGKGFGFYRQRGVWSVMTVDEELGILYLPVEPRPATTTAVIARGPVR
jgi:hypothetical protein